jgi:hypothetical protein
MSDNETGAHESETKNPLLSDKMYTKLEFLARVVLPAFATLYGTVALLWGVPNVAQVVGTIVAVDTFLGIFLGIAQRSYDKSDAPYNGTIEAIPGSDGTVLTNLVLESDPANVNKLVLKVNNAS